MLRVECFSLGTDDSHEFDRVVAECSDGVVGFINENARDFDKIASGRTFRRAAAFALRAVADQLLADNPAFPEAQS